MADATVSIISLLVVYNYFSKEYNGKPQCPCHVLGRDIEGSDVLYVIFKPGRFIKVRD